MSMSFGRNTMPKAICSSTRQEFISMATFTAHAHRDFRHPSWLHGEELHGTDSSDIFLGSAGADTIYAGGGSDNVIGGSGGDTIIATAFGATAFVGPWGNDTVHGGDGNDGIYYGQTTSDVTLWGDRGDDVIVSGSGNDKIYGGDGNDKIWGGAGNDTIFGDNALGISGNDTIVGGEGNDTIYGGGGNDVIWGGADVDYLTGGKGADTFSFAAGDSGLHWQDADVIYDFKPSFDRGFPGDVIHFGGMEKGTSSNFFHGTFNSSHDYSDAAAYEHALKEANHGMVLNGGEWGNGNMKYVFETDGHNGWLFADMDGDRHFDTGIELKGVTDMHAWNIV
jgi:Ca2+-binding RTX toxin-like protein